MDREENPRRKSIDKTNYTVRGRRERWGTISKGAKTKQAGGNHPTIGTGRKKKNEKTEIDNLSVIWGRGGPWHNVSVKSSQKATTKR